MFFTSFSIFSAKKNVFPKKKSFGQKEFFGQKWPKVFFGPKIAKKNILAKNCQKSFLLQKKFFLPRKLPKKKFGPKIAKNLSFCKKHFFAKKVFWDKNCQKNFFGPKIAKRIKEKNEKKKKLKERN